MSSQRSIVEKEGKQGTFFIETLFFAFLVQKLLFLQRYNNS